MCLDKAVIICTGSLVLWVLSLHLCWCPFSLRKSGSLFEGVLRARVGLFIYIRFLSHMLISLRGCIYVMLLVRVG